MGCISWVETMIYFMIQLLLFWMQYCVILDRLSVITGFIVIRSFCWIDILVTCILQVHWHQGYPKLEPVAVKKPWKLCVKWTTTLFGWIVLCDIPPFIVRRAGLLWSQQDFEWRWSVPLFKCLTVLEFSFILFDLCLLITFFNFIMNYVPIVTFWIFTYHKIWILSIMFCFIWSYWIIYFLACLEVSWRVVS